MTLNPPGLTDSTALWTLGPLLSPSGGEAAPGPVLKPPKLPNKAKTKH